MDSQYVQELVGHYNSLLRNFRMLNFDVKESCSERTYNAIRGDFTACDLNLMNMADSLNCAGNDLHDGFVCVFDPDDAYLGYRAPNGDTFVPFAATWETDDDEDDEDDDCDEDCEQCDRCDEPCEYYCDLESIVLDTIMEHNDRIDRMVALWQCISEECHMTALSRLCDIWEAVFQDLVEDGKSLCDTANDLIGTKTYSLNEDYQVCERTPEGLKVLYDTDN